MLVGIDEIPIEKGREEKWKGKNAGASVEPLQKSFTMYQTEVIDPWYFYCYIYIYFFP